jgi:hypothetical protein
VGGAALVALGMVEVFELLEDVRVGLPGGIPFALELELQPQRIGEAAQRTKCPGHHPLGDAGCVGIGAAAAFRVDRLRDPEPTGLPSIPRTLPAEDAAVFVSSRLLDLAPVYRADVILSLPLEEAARRLVRDTAAELEAIDHTRCRVRTSADTLEWLAFSLALLNCDFEVLAPPELVAYVGTLGRRLNRADTRT